MQGEVCGFQLEDSRLWWHLLSKKTLPVFLFSIATRTLEGEIRKGFSRCFWNVEGQWWTDEIGAKFSSISSISWQKTVAIQCSFISVNSGSEFNLCWLFFQLSSTVFFCLYRCLVKFSRSYHLFFLALTRIFTPTGQEWHRRGVKKASSSNLEEVINPRNRIVTWPSLPTAVFTLLAMWISIKTCYRQ